MDGASLKPILDKYEKGLLLHSDRVITLNNTSIIKSIKHFMQMQKHRGYLF